MKINAVYFLGFAKKRSGNKDQKKERSFHSLIKSQN
jgi:hypothetical protein